MGDGSRKIWQRERELWEKVWIQDGWEKWKAGKIGRGTDTGLLKEARWSLTRRREEMLFVPQLLTRLKWWLYYHLTGDIDTHRGAHFLKGVDMKMFYFGGQTSAVYVYRSNAPSLRLSLRLSLSLSSVFLSSISYFIPLCVHWGVTNWWFSGLKEAQMEKQMERVIGHVYAFYLRFLPPFFSLPHSLTLSFVPPLSSLMNKDGRHALAPRWIFIL